MSELGIERKRKTRQTDENGAEFIVNLLHFNYLQKSIRLVTGAVSPVLAFANS